MEQQISAESGYAEQMQKTVEEIRSYERKNYRLNRIRALCSILCLLLCIAAAVFLFGYANQLLVKVNEVAETVTEAGGHFNAVAEDLEKVEFEKLGKSLQEIADISKDTVQQANDAASGLEKIVSTADSVLENLTNLKIDALNNGIRELNSVLENIKEFFDKLPF